MYLRLMAETHCVIKEAKLTRYHQRFWGISSCPWAIYLYKIRKSLNIVFSKNLLNNFH